MMYSEYIKNGGKGIIQLLKENQCLNYLPSEAITPLDTAFNFENGMKMIYPCRVGGVLTHDDAMRKLIDVEKLHSLGSCQ